MSSLGRKTTLFAMEHPRLIARAMLVITLVLLAGAGLPTLFPKQLGFLPQATIDTDPENMLPAGDSARAFHSASKERFALYDAVVVGVVNEQDADGVFNPETLAKVYRLTEFAKQIEGVIVPDVMAPSTMDNIENAGPGTVRFNWLMPAPPANQEEALAVRDRAMRIPFLEDTLISADGRALVIYVPIVAKDRAHEVSKALRAEIARIGAGPDQFHIAGLPVAEDTFGIEMFIQMAISAPMAMLVIFLLMWVFFRRFSVILSPMLVAMASALTTMALLVITGNTVHIMSSMIPIFIMPIAVLDAVHIISDFFDTYPSIGDRRKTIEKVMGHLSAPMLFTSLTTAAGFGSLALTPIPPVQVFGIFVAIGVLAAWVFTVLFIPAYLMLLPDKRLEGFGRVAVEHESKRGLLHWLGRMRPWHARVILLGGLGLVAVAVIGIGKINVNDNPTKWFEEGHEIRIADRVLNSHFGGTYDAYLHLSHKRAPYSAEAYGKEVSEAAQAELVAIRAVFAEMQSALRARDGQPLLDGLESLETMTRERGLHDIDPSRRVGFGLVADWLAEQLELADEMSDETEGEMSDETEGEDAQAPELSVALLGPALESRATEVAHIYERIVSATSAVASGEPADVEAFRAELHKLVDALPAGEANSVSGSDTASAFVERQAQAGQIFKQPEMLAYMEGLQAALASHPIVGKSNSLADIVKVVHRDLLSGNNDDYRLPANRDGVAQTLAQYQSSHRKDDLWHFVTSDYAHAVIWFQLKSGDNMDMQKVVAAVDDYVALHPPPVSLELPKWFGLTYINVVWQKKMVKGMVSALLGSFVIVLVMMIVLFRSLLWGLLSMIPLTLTVGLIYGILGLVGKDYDMPVAVLSSLSLGLAVDYSIHFLARARELHAKHGTWALAQKAVFEEPARAITRNVIVVGCGFLPLLLAPLVPYQTVGFLIASILFAAGLATLLLLPALIAILEPVLFRAKANSTSTTKKDN